MGTRGFIGVVIDGEEKIAYNHWDSYPGGIGLSMLEFCRTHAYHDTWDLVGYVARDLKVVSDGTPPTEEQIEMLAPYTNLNVSERSTSDWYCLLYETHGNITTTLVAGYLVDARDFALDSLFCEWGYLINLDKEVFEVYKGSQRKPHSLGRFADREPSTEYGTTYYPVALVASYELNNLPKPEKFVEELEDDE